MRKKKQFSQYNYFIIGIILLIIVVGVLKQQGAFVFEKNKVGAIKGVTIGSINYPCGSADDICPSEYAGCQPCITDDPDCIHVCGW